MYKRGKPRRTEVSLQFVFWVGPPLLLKDVQSFVFLNGTEDLSVTSNFCCGKTEPRKSHAPPRI